jgi:hypothetical protein
MHYVGLDIHKKTPGWVYDHMMKQTLSALIPALGARRDLSYFECR